MSKLPAGFSQFPLTKRQREVFEFCRDHITAKGYAPSLGEIGRRFGLSSLATVHKHLENLRVKGYLRRQWNHSRAMEIVQIGEPCPHCGQRMAIQESSHL